MNQKILLSMLKVKNVVVPFTPAVEKKNSVIQHPLQKPLGGGKRTKKEKHEVACAIDS